LEKNVYLVNVALRQVFNARSLATQAPAVAEVQPRQAPQVTTGWNKAKWPQQEMMEIHRRAAKIEGPALDRRRQFGALKVLVSIGACLVAFIIFGLSFLMIMPWDPHAPWHTPGLPTPWTNRP